MPDAVDAIPGLLQRWRADSIAAADGATITSWPAITGNALTPAGTGPTMRTNGIGGQPAAEFTLAGNNRMSAAVTSGINVLTVCVVVDPAVTGQRNIFENNLDVMVNSSGTSWNAYQGFTINSGAVDVTSPAAVVVTFNSVSSTIHRNGVQIASGNTGTNARNAAAYVGGHPSLTTRAFEGLIAEVVVFSGALSAANRQIFENYAIARYGLGPTQSSVLAMAAAGGMSVGGSASRSVALSAAAAGALTVGGVRQQNAVVAAGAAAALAVGAVRSRVSVLPVAGVSGFAIVTGASAVLAVRGSPAMVVGSRQDYLRLLAMSAAGQLTIWPVLIQDYHPGKRVSAILLDSGGGLAELLPGSGLAVVLSPRYGAVITRGS